MPATWNITLSIARSDLLAVAGLPWPVELRPHRRAKSVRLRIDERRSRLTLTYPHRMSRRSALDWASRQREWVEGQLRNVPTSEPLADGTTIPVRGMDTTLRWDPRSPRTPHLGDGELVAGGTAESFAGRIERYLKALARDELARMTATIAKQADVSIASVSVGDARSRWGSCSASGAIRYSWRLILAPPHILEWVVAHEVAHRRHMDHGPQFHALEAELFSGSVSAARADLRRLGPRLKRIGLTV